jgi:hypothetical protein
MIIIGLHDMIIPGFNISLAYLRFYFGVSSVTSSFAVFV